MSLGANIVVASRNGCHVIVILKPMHITVVVTVLANAVVLLVLWMKRKRSKTTHCFIAALAISDICMSVAVHPMIIATWLSAKLKFPSMVCRAENSIVWVFA